ncbi:MAG TPA: bifunctional phosphopantothenoylcysteine decarboxylase/phosphopantothenate--cysteine ligase CoaBC [Ignavibacteriaceae bacterium]|nr:bifunctional phosphopantothenoylcysteine decarboxylase/phosphopantothenate--cysteine ligase CoaBC [Ignavibacteriaceae bacterium]
MQKDILSGKKILLGVTGCIAAYKSVYIVRELIKRGSDVKVIMTPAATEFITPLTLSALTKNEVVVKLFPKSTSENTSIKTWHIDLALWADLMIIAPATMNTVAKIAHGFADNALTTLVMALRSPLLISPAADVDMYENKIARKNLEILKEAGYYILDAEKGELASGLSGTGRLPETAKIIDSAELILSGIKNDLAGKKILVTAGPTYEDIDPVRYIGNRSSGKMGFEIAKSSFLRGAEVTLITGPTNELSYQEIKLINVRTAKEMKDAVVKELKKNHILIMSAAVADYKPANSATKKIKKEDNLSSIKLTKTDDILSSLKKGNKISVGFALETDNELNNALKKLKSKNLDLIVLNSLKDKNSGFETETNKIKIIHKSGEMKDFPLQSKFQVANNILTEILKIS